MPAPPSAPGSPGTPAPPATGSGQAGGPSGESSGQPGDKEGGEQQGQESDDWLEDAGGDGDDGWATSNQLPGGEGSGETGASNPSTGAAGDETVAGAGGEQSEEGSGGLDEVLDKALEDFDGTILTEREVIANRSREGSSTTAGGNGDSGNSNSPQGSAAQGSTSTAYIPKTRDMPNAPTAGSGSTNRVPDDTPDARDDDVVARQLREAAINEIDPVLKEKLWEEYRRYKGSS
jgi:hypothetical protein